MEKLLRILFVMSAIAFVTTVTACADKKSAKTGGDDKTAKTGGDDKTAKTGGDDKTANTGGDDKTAKTPSIFKFTSTGKGVTIDESKDVYKITINPSLLTYPRSFVLNAPVGTFAPADIFTVTFTDDKQGFIIPTTADKADALTTTHVADLSVILAANLVAGVANAEGLFLGAPNDITHSFLADDAADDPVFGFSAAELNAAWSTLAPRAKVVVGGGKPDIPEFDGIPNIVPDTKVRVMCVTIITGINKDSFKTKAPTVPNNLAIAKGTETKCAFSLVGESPNDVDQKAAYKAWAEAAVELAKDDATKNIQKMGFVGIVTGDDTASEITKAAGSLLNADITAATSAKLVKAYKTSLQKVEIVIAPVK